MIFFDDADAVMVQHATAASPDRLAARTVAGRLAAGAAAAVLMVVAVVGAVALTVALAAVTHR